MSSPPAPTHGAKPDPPPQDIINNEACEEMDPSSDSVHTGDNAAVMGPAPPSTRAPAAAASAAAAQQQPGRTTPPTSLAIMPGEITGPLPSLDEN